MIINNKRDRDSLSLLLFIIIVSFNTILMDSINLNVSASENGVYNYF
jgi:hypothetical protein